jgi:hypothetical protein
MDFTGNLAVITVDHGRYLINAVTVVAVTRLKGNHSYQANKLILTLHFFGGRHEKQANFKTDKVRRTKS